jgi:hypothetical protein
MIWSFLCQCVANELAHGPGVGQPPGNPTLRIDPLEVPQKQGPKVDARGDAGPPQTALVITPAQSLHGAVEVVLLQNLIQPIVKGMRRRAHHLATDDPQIFLSLPLLAGSHGHAV